MSTEEVRLLRAFIASPGDMVAERKTVQDAIDEVNRSSGSQLHFVIRDLTWENDTYPAFGVTAQDEILRQVGRYDIFIGLMGARYGSATGVAASGTEQEFNHALERLLADSEPPALLFFFGDPLVKLSSIDPLQLLQVRRFQQRLRDLGFYYGTFQSPEDLRKTIVRGLGHVVSELVAGRSMARRSEYLQEKEEHLQLDDWRAKASEVYPQRASYIDLPLEARSSVAYEVTGRLRFYSPYFRFGFKLLPLDARRFGETTVHSQGRNLLVHIGRNEAIGEIFATTYTNGIRTGPNRPLLGSEPGQTYEIRLSVDREGVLEFVVAGHQAYRKRVSEDLCRRLMVIGWGDSQGFDLSFSNIQLTTWSK